ncbi:MAG: DUF6011 domain-containing protein [Negativicutes bacterium]|nr:DUF6011 domain-containing protein [Negativicutes bacterium]
MEKESACCCGWCGRKLKNAKAIERGFGRVCFRKNRREKAKAEYEERQLKLNFDDVA